jgi:hypothetical protein
VPCESVGTPAWQAARGDKLTISEVLAEYLRAERGRLAPKTYAQYTEVIALFTQSLNGYAANSLSRFERARFDKLFNAEGEQHREFCDIFGPEHMPAGLAPQKARQSENLSALWARPSG